MSQFATHPPLTSAPPSAAFSPPTADQVQSWIQRHPPRARSAWAFRGPLIAIVVLVAMSFAMQSAVIGVLPWLGFVALLIYMGWLARHNRELEMKVSYLQELSAVRQHAPAIRGAWRLLPQVIRMHELHGRVLAIMAYNLDQVRAYDAAILTYDYLVDKLPTGHPGSIQLRLQRSVAQLANHQLVDADDNLRRLRGSVEEIGDVVLSGAYRMAVLLQAVRTNHFQEAVDEADDLTEALRPLGIDAGYGHALLALSCWRLCEQGQEDVRSRAEASWRRATLLLSPERLAWRFVELADLRLAGLPPEPRPIG